MRANEILRILDEVPETDVLKQQVMMDKHRFAKYLSNFNIMDQEHSLFNTHENIKIEDFIEVVVKHFGEKSIPSI